MRFLYNIIAFPKNPEGYNLTAYTEGTLRILLGSVVFLDASDILLVELAIVLKKWLLSLENGPVDLYYASMDFEEEPVLALRYDAFQNQFLPESVWAKSDPCPISLAEAKSAAEGYLVELREELWAKYSVDLNKTLEEAVRGEVT
jgi:hypothetical protein